MNKKPISHPLKGLILPDELEESDALMILSLMPHLGPVRIRLLVKQFGSGLKALLAPPESIASLPSFGNKFANLWLDWPHDNGWKENIILLNKCNASIITYASPNYPKGLLKISDAPMMLYVQGNLTAADQRSIAIIGTRQASIYGLEMAKQFAYDLAALGFTVISGLARGIDTAAHLGALERGRTIAVIGSGLNDIYPAENRTLARRIETQGAVISEFPMSTPPDRQNFPQRNRIVSGMTLATLLIEAPVKSGAMITMERAEQQGKLLFALPGRVDENFRGNHSLIKQGKARLVESAADISAHFDSLFGSLLPKDTITIDSKPLVQLNKEEEMLLKSLPNHELSIEHILASSNMSISALNVLLMKLVLKGCLKEFPGKVYRKIGAIR